MTDLERLTASRAAREIVAGAITSEALVRACLDRIAEREPVVGAWAFIDPERALAEARAKDQGPRRGALHGVPVGIKDIIDAAGMPTGHGSPIYDGKVAHADAAAVALLRAAGAVILGKTVTTEFAAFAPGKTANPHNPAHLPGGSSSGSAAAVADFMVPAALGTQTVGSTIRPAAYSGAVGFKPTFGLFPLAGIKPQAPSLDTLGIIVRAVEDVALLAGVLLDLGGPLRLPERGAPPRIGFCRSPHWPKAQPATIRAMEESCRTLAAAGARVADIDLSANFDRVLDAQMAIVGFEMVRAMAYERYAHRQRLSARLRDFFVRGEAIALAEYREAQGLAAACRAEIAAAFERCDVILTPSQSGEAPLGLDTPSDLLFQRLWTVLHLPCLTLPAFKGEKGLPIGVQLVGAAGRDEAFLADARWIEARLMPRGMA
jgi:amidase